MSNQGAQKAGIDKNTASFDSSPIKLFVEECIEKTAAEAIVFIGNHGGYYQVKNPKLHDDDYELPYHIYNNVDFSPSLDELENGISRYMDINLDSCIRNFEDFGKLGFQIKHESFNSNTYISLDSASFDINGTVTVEKGDTIMKIENFRSDIRNAPLGRFYDVSKEIVKFQLQDPSSVCLSCLYNLGEKNKLSIDVSEYKNSTLIFNIAARNTSIVSPEMQSNFTFAIKYTGFTCQNLAGLEDPMFLLECINAKYDEISNKTSLKQPIDFDRLAKKGIYIKS
ncbi:hypothetical protein HYY71_04955 [Candidatus Woesearchaeota archaeon]|nr:hypothetical protein [Candidatus Woesearchaeota archaeon]